MTTITNDHLSDHAIRQLHQAINRRLQELYKDEPLEKGSELEVLVELDESLMSDRGHGVLDEHDVETLVLLMENERDLAMDKVRKANDYLTKNIQAGDLATASTLTKRLNDSLWQVEKRERLLNVLKGLEV